MGHIGLDRSPSDPGSLVVTHPISYPCAIVRTATGERGRGKSVPSLQTFLALTVEVEKMLMGHFGWMLVLTVR